MPRDTLYLLDPMFTDADLPGAAYYCRDCTLIDGLLANFPDRARALTVVRVPHSRPRALLVDRFGAERQWLPLLELDPADPADPALAGVEHADGRAIITDFAALLAALTVRHAFPVPHP